jgi:hypothetical protein
MSDRTQYLDKRTGNTPLSLLLSVYLPLLVMLQISGCATTYPVNTP